MRPIIKGNPPQNAGLEIIFSEYGDARPHLIDRIGDYCSYCENQISNPAVEHIHGKDATPGVAVNWYNFLLGCSNCNSIKGEGFVDINSYYWPDVHNTHILFDYLPGGVIKLKANLPANVDMVRAQNILNLVGLERYGNTASDKDRRWIKRMEAFGKAEQCLHFYENNGLPINYLTSIVNTATSTGFWSVWMKVFESYYSVQEALIVAFLGTFDQCLYTNINRL